MNDLHADLPPDLPPRRRRWWPWVVITLLAMAGAYALWPHITQGQAKTSSPPAGAGGGNSRGVPVVVAATRSGNMGIYLSGLGTATPLSTVTVHSRVDGELIEVAFKEGQIVKQGDLLARIDPRPFEVQLTQAEGQKAKDEATLKNAQLDLARFQDLANRGILPKQQVDTQLATVNQAEGAIKSDQGQIDSARLNLTYSRITSPISGRVGLRLIDQGNIVHASDTTGLVVITQLDPIAVVFTIPEDSVGSVMRPLQSGVHLTVDAYDRDGKMKITSGTLLTVDNEIDQNTGTVKLKGSFQNRNNALFPNQFVNARILVDTIRNAVIAPSAAIQHTPQSTFVYVVKSDDTVEMRTVEVRLTDGDDTAIKSGLAVGDNVVIDGVDKLQQGTKVSARRADAAADAGTRPPANP
ncbi:MAG TPA: MdtA/MuxA family multidrug efflux RND transporter periplasmic adaptor subunit [Vicinamibacterales bacterium]|jgi:multidrug efflux system membrane fusion protein|nr:MdtA/MuxA family multidrug efflux RND transporter periplasmic adaptor subunit [Vicinamibacterales bacterium]